MVDEATSGGARLLQAESLPSDAALHAGGFFCNSLGRQGCMLVSFIGFLYLLPETFESFYLIVVAFTKRHNRATRPCIGPTNPHSHNPVRRRIHRQHPDVAGWEGNIQLQSEHLLSARHRSMTR